MDPFCTLEFGKQSLKTKTHNSGGKTPVWNEIFEIEVKNINDELTLTVYDEE